MEISVIVMMFLMDYGTMMTDYLLDGTLIKNMLPYIARKKKDGKANKMGLRIATLQCFRSAFKESTKRLLPRPLNVSYFVYRQLDEDLVHTKRRD